MINLRKDNKKHSSSTERNLLFRNFGLISSKYLFIPVAIILNLFFFYPAFFEGKTFFFRDIHRWFYPMKFFLAKSFQSGEIPFWCPYYFCGSPFMSDIQSGVFYPLSVLFLLVPFPLSFNSFIILHLVLGFCFFYLFIVSLGLSRKSALITAISYCFGGYVFSTINTLNNLTTAIWLPAILWSFNSAAQKPGLKTGYVLTICFLSAAVLGGEPQLFLLMAATFFLYAVIYDPHKVNGKTHRIRAGSAVLLLGVWATAIAFVQLGPTFLDYQFSVRLGGLPYQEASRYSLSWEMLKHFFVPIHFSEGFASDATTLKNFFPGHGDLPWLLTIYPGFIILPMAILGVAVSFSEKRLLIWPIIFLISVILALGDNTPVHHLSYKVFPIFRFPEKFIFTAGFSLLVMAAYGFDGLFRKLHQKGNNARIVFFIVAIGTLLDLFANHRHLNPLWDNDFYQYNHSALQPIVDDPGLFRVFADKMQRPHTIQNSIINSHIKWQMMALPNLGIVKDLYHVGGVPALELRYQHLITEMLNKPWEEKIRFLKLANVKYIISQDPLDKEPKLKGQVEKVNGLVYRVRDFLPRAWIVGRSIRMKQGTVEELTKKSFNPAQSVLGNIVFENSFKHTQFSPKCIDKIIYNDVGKIRIETRTEKPGILVVSESSYPGWKVYVDGRDRECLWLDLLFQGVLLEQGKHTIEFQFRPKYFPLFLFISISSLLCLILCWIWLKFKHPSDHTNFRNNPLHS